MVERYPDCQKESFILKSLHSNSFNQTTSKSLTFLSKLKIHFPDRCRLNFSLHYFKGMHLGLSMSHLRKYPWRFSFPEYFLFKSIFLCRICSFPPILLHSFENYSTLTTGCQVRSAKDQKSSQAAHLRNSCRVDNFIIWKALKLANLTYMIDIHIII